MSVGEVLHCPLHVETTAPCITACCMLQRWNIRTCSSAPFCCQTLNEFCIMPTGSRRAAAAKLLRSPAPEQRAAGRRAGPPAAGAGPALCRRPRSVGRLCAVAGRCSRPKPYHGSLNAEACAQAGSSVQLLVDRRQDSAPCHVAFCNDRPHGRVPAAANTPAHAHPPVPASWDNEAQQRQAPGWSLNHGREHSECSHPPADCSHALKHRRIRQRRTPGRSTWSPIGSVAMQSCRTRSRPGAAGRRAT